MMRWNRAPLLALIALMLASATPGVAGKPPRQDFDPAFDFTKLATYDFRVNQKKTEGVVAQDLLPKLEALLDQEMTAKGYRRDKEAPDFLVMFDGHLAEIIIPDDGVYVDISQYVVWTVPGRGQGGASTGMLAVRMMLPDQKEPFWWAADDAMIEGKITPPRVWKKAEPVARRIVGLFPAKGTAPAKPAAS